MTPRPLTMAHTPLSGQPVGENAREIQTEQQVDMARDEDPLVHTQLPHLSLCSDIRAHKTVFGSPP